MTDAELLEKIKVGLGITGAYQDETLKLYIEDVKNYLSDAGVSAEIISSSAAVGVIIRGVSDLWNYGMGTAELSTYFIQRAFQLKYIIGELEIGSSAGAEVGTTKITVPDADAFYRYKFTNKMPTLDEDLSGWEEWDGTSDIVAEGGSKICVAEVTSGNLAIRAGITTVIVNLG